MAGGAFSSPYHFSRSSRAVPRGAGGDAPPGDARAGGLADPPGHVGHRRRVRGRLRVGRGLQPGVRPGLRPPAERPCRAHGHWLPAPNGIHFHPPTSLWVAHHGAADEPADRTAGRPRPRRHPRPARPRQAAARRRVPRHAAAGHAVLGFDGPDESIADGARRTSCSPRRSGWRRSRAREFPPERADDPATLIDRHDEVAAALARDGGRHRAPRRLGRPADRRAVRPARELRDEQRRRARADLLRRPPAAGPADASGPAAGRSTRATRSTGCAARWARNEDPA